MNTGKHSFFFVLPLRSFASSVMGRMPECRERMDAQKRPVNAFDCAFVVKGSGL